MVRTETEDAVLKLLRGLFNVVEKVIEALSILCEIGTHAFEFVRDFFVRTFLGETLAFQRQLPQLFRYSTRHNTLRSVSNAVAA